MLPAILLNAITNYQGIMYANIGSRAGHQFETKLVCCLFGVCIDIVFTALMVLGPGCNLTLI